MTENKKGLNQIIKVEIGGVGTVIRKENKTSDNEKKVITSTK